MRTRKEALQEQERPKRVRMGRRNVLTLKGITDQDEFHYHWFLDEKDRLSEALDAGYTFVYKGGVSAGDKTVESARGDDTLMVKASGNGRTLLYLMKIPMEWYKEDQQAKQKEILQLESDMTRSKPEFGQYGQVEMGTKTTPF